MPTSLAFNYGKYRGILISVALFLLLDASVLLLNFYISFEIADDAVGVNLAGRQRMLSQRMAKTLLTLDAARADPIAFKTAYDELLLSKTLFDTSLSAFTEGGRVLGAGTQYVELEPVANRAGRDALHNTLQLWRPYQNAVNKLLELGAADLGAPLSPQTEQALTQAVTMARQYNLPILAAMNDLTLSLEQLATAKANRLRLIQTVGISLAIINFLFILLHFVRQLRESDTVIERARRDTSEILQTVNEGLLLIDSKLIIGDQYSAKLKELLGERPIAGESFERLLENLISEKDAHTARSFIELLFDKKVKEKLIGALNPLHLVEVNIAQASGGFVSKHLQFSFARAYQGSRISHVLVTVLDVSEQIKLARELEQSRQQNESQLAMITGLLHTHPSLLNTFINNSFQCFNRINNSLRQPAKSQAAMREKAVTIFREVHNFKGEASSLKLDYFENAAHTMEHSLTELSRKQDLSGNDYLGLTVQLENLINYTQQVQQLTEKMGQFALVTQAQQKTFLAPTGSASSDNWSHLDDFVHNIALRNGKQVHLVTSGLTELSLSRECEQGLKDVCIQLLRNAVVHGIETPSERQLAEKSPVGRIDVRLAKISKSEMELSVLDDGQGLDYQAIRRKALALGKWPESEIESWSNKQLLGLIFQNGFSTARELNKDAGRGVGMGVVMKYVTGQGGKINLASRPGEYCRLVISLPIIEQAAPSVDSTTPPGAVIESPKLPEAAYAIADDC